MGAQTYNERPGYGTNMRPNALKLFKCDYS